MSSKMNVCLEVFISLTYFLGAISFRDIFAIMQSVIILFRKTFRVFQRLCATDKLKIIVYKSRQVLKEIMLQQ